MNFYSFLPTIYLTAGTIILLLGLVIYRENPKQLINRVTAVMLGFAAFGAIMGAFGMLILPLTGNARIDLSFFYRLFLLWELFFPSLLLFALLFPLPASVMRFHPRIGYLIYIPHAFHFLFMMFIPNSYQIFQFASTEPGGIFGQLVQPLNLLLEFIGLLFRIFYDFHTHFFALINLVYVILAIVIMYRNYQQLRNPQFKQQVTVLLWGIRASVGLYAIAFLIPKLIPLNLTENIGHIFSITALLIGAGSIAWAIIRFQFLNTRLFIRQGIVFSLASGIVVGLFLILYSQTEQVAKSILGVQLPLVQVMFLLFAIFLFQPILNGIEKWIEKIFARDLSDYRQVLHTLSYDIITILDLEKLKKRLKSILSQTLHVDEIHLVLQNERGIYSPDNNTSHNSNEVWFRPEGEFIKFMESVSSPILFDELKLRLSNPDELNKLQKLKPYLLVPLSHRNHLEGVLSLGERELHTTFSGEDLNLLNVLSNQIAIAIENSRLYAASLEKQHIEKEMSLAREIQRMLLPLEKPTSNHFELSALTIPSREVGGDYYDFHYETDNRLGITIADIAGKSIPAALLMANLQAITRVSARQFQKPSKVVENVNHYIYNTTTVEKYATFLYGVFHTRTGKFCYTNAGHNYPILRRADGTTKVLEKSNVIIGVLPEVKYENINIKLERMISWCATPTVSQKH